MREDILNSVLMIFLSCISFALFERIDFNEACSPKMQILTAEEGDIYSPGFQENKPYPLNIHCTFVLHLNNEKNIITELKFINLEDSHACLADSVELQLYSKIDSKKKKVVRTYCGSNVSDRMLILAKGMEKLHIRFSSDYRISGRGFHLHYKYTTETSLCGSRELECRNSKCVPASVTCNQKDDCGDGTDEEDCGQDINQSVQCGLPSEVPHTLIESRIVGGQEAVPGSWPWQVELAWNDFLPSGQLCGGSLINSRYVVTAAHCVIGFLLGYPLRVHLGSHNKFQKEQYQQIRYVQSAHLVIDNYLLKSDQEKADNDIALLLLNAQVEFTTHVRPICLPKRDYAIPVGTICYTSGWGETRGTGGSSVLKQTAVKIVGTCNATTRDVNPKTMICGDVYNSIGDSCNGDSGGPLMCKVDEYWYLVGIVSFGPAETDAGGLCAIDNHPGIYQKVANRVDWILNTIKNENK